LKGESDVVKEAIFGVMSEKAAQMLKDDMEYMGPIPNSSAKEARKKISDTILDLAEKGEIIINVKGEPLVK
jgi:flagellar motor switch protein FliG